MTKVLQVCDINLCQHPPAMQELLGCRISSEKKPKKKPYTRKQTLPPLVQKTTRTKGCDQAQFDSYCDPNCPIVVCGNKVERARERIKDCIVQTPCTHSRLSDSLGIKLYLKKEFMQYTGSFKERGAANALLNLTEKERKCGVVAMSAGNHAQALAYQGSKLGVKVTVVMPTTAPLVKVNSCINLGANVVKFGANLEEAKAKAMELRNQFGYVYINGYDQEHILAGQGTIGLEILEQVPDVDYVIVPIGGGGLISGISAAIKNLKPNVKIIGVESERCPCWHTATRYGRPVHCKKSLEGAKDSIADGLSVVEVGHNSFATANSLIDKLITVTENHIAVAILHLLEQEKSVVEGAGAISYAALISGQLPELKGKRVVCVLSGGNIDANVLGRVIDRALVQEGRISRFNVVISDRPGSLAELLATVADEGASIKNINHERLPLASYVFKCGLQVTVETRDIRHATQVRKVLEKKYKDDFKWLDDRGQSMNVKL